MTRASLAAPALCLLLGLALAACATDPRAPRVLCEDAGWCWFQDERALVLEDRWVVLGSVANGGADPLRKGDVQLTVWDLADDSVRTVELSDRFEADDHDVPALCALSDGQLLATW